MCTPRSRPKLHLRLLPVQSSYLFEGQEILTAVILKGLSCRSCKLLRDGFLLVLFSTLKLEVTYLSETSVHFQRTTRNCVSEDVHLQFY
jgi:hypothetical protein